jgi:hypothetical protein
VVRLRGQLCNFSSESLKTEFGDLSLQFCKVGVEEWKDGRVEGWKNGRMEGWNGPRTIDDGR